MKKVIALFLALSCLPGLIGYAKEHSIKASINGNMKTYYALSDGTWLCDDVFYQYRLEITGRLNNAACDCSYVYLSNLENLTFEQAWKASGLSSDANDYFPIEDAVLVELNSVERKP